MGTIVSLGKFRREIASYTSFLLVHEHTFTPLSFSALIDHITVNISASPYVVFRNDASKFCLSHIKTITESCVSEVEKHFIFMCNDYSHDSQEILTKFTLKCSGFLCI